ncbi:sulfotransferase domain-containing protein [Hoyosella sp. G463]|uniref:Sulfotransferase domain-containing protein n=1 Tax=Lolliginicoccus lacisalsi TaxID=2742202 RepID=A0A927JD16_9ACTN|nr:sulfotransferase domain-containing protein [Lolliginicoccus lacisalsi]MBD8506878.1 sulfotransferase domain-containing protein [Lolliginicoccus lacisalsi]
MAANPSTTLTHDDRMLECYRIVDKELEIRHRGEFTPRDIWEMARMTVSAQFLPHYFSYVPGWRRALRRLGGDRIMPDFACIGAIKSGTSELATYLMQHPNMIVPLSKEPNRENPGDWRIFYPTRKEVAELEAVRGPMRAGYFEPRLHQVAVLDGFHAQRPDGKVIIMLRDPVRRAYSHFKWDFLATGRKSHLSGYMTSYRDYVRRALDVFPAHGFPTSIVGLPPLEAGIYAPSVRLWIERFGAENIHFIGAEEFFADIPGTLNSIFRFLGLPEHEPAIRQPVNTNNIDAPPEDPEARELLRDFYQPYNKELFAILGRELDWI